MTEAISDAALFVAQFADAWTNPCAERLAALVHPHTSNVYPGLSAPLDGPGVRRYFAAVLDLLPDLRLVVTRWAAHGHDVYIEWTASASIGRRRVHWAGVDVVTLEGGKEIRSFIYCDPGPLRRALARSPALWIRLLRGVLSRNERRPTRAIVSLPFARRSA